MNSAVFHNYTKISYIMVIATVQIQYTVNVSIQYIIH